MDTYQLSDKQAEVHLTQNWSDVVGSMIASHTSKISIYRDKLYLTVNSAPLKSELNYHKNTLVSKVNTFLGKEIIKEIIVQ